MQDRFKHHLQCDKDLNPQSCSTLQAPHRKCEILQLCDWHIHIILVASYFTIGLSMSLISSCFVNIFSCHV